MKKEELISLISKYSEWDDDLDVTSCPTGWVKCTVCGGGGSLNTRDKRPPTHSNDCLRLYFEKEYKSSVVSIGV